MKVISKVEATKEELGYIAKVRDLNCDAINNCEECPLYLGRSRGCIKSVARETLSKLVPEDREAESEDRE